ncbi:fungal-specific transcription factor domain-containing protein [Radiomyces spectabilis]|uniref:fungal-specific transcription factor domain-containing protein n=1 Tax=Radiomyces spectabilis TaxID=64574 RepID=UPI00221F2CC2|nr:fungal-specific transcription factor domain-containing protein [Radiomyces spectabilis]KAI8384440.1 fungal-specific transcription factor domain-containing protein [Radiomyces spectabilis]
MNAYQQFTTSTPIHTPPTPTPSSSALSSPPLKRTRAKRSCDFCRKRKSRCDADNSIPCSNCKAWGYTCEFQTVRKKRGPPSVYVDNLEKRCKKMETLLMSLTNVPIKELERNNFQLTGRTQRVMASPVDESDSSSEDDDEDDDDEQGGDDVAIYDSHSDPTLDIRDRLSGLNIRDYDTLKYTGQSAGLQLFDNDLFKSKTFVRWPGRDDVVLQMMADDELMVVRTDTTASGKPDKRLDVGISMRSAIFDNPRSCSPPSSATLKKPSKQLMDKMIGLYFSHLHHFLPIVNKYRFLQQCNSNFKSKMPIVVQSVLALAFRFASQHFPSLESAASDFADSYFRKVMKQLRDLQRSRLCHVQAALLMTLYLDMDGGDVESVQWCTLGSAIRMAQDLGLHRSCEHWHLPPSEIETRHRVFYACYVLDRWMGARAGKPLTILDRDFDTAMPSYYEISDSPAAASDAKEPIYRPFILLIKLSEILGRVLKALYAPNAKNSNSNANLDDPTILAVFDRRLKHWKASLDETVDSVGLSVAQKVNLQIFYNTIVLLLHRPFLQLSTARFPHLESIVIESRSACDAAAARISSLVQQQRAQQADPTSYGLLCLPTCFIYAMFQSSLVHLSNALKDRISAVNLARLKQSIALVQQYQHLGPAPRALEILNMLVTVNELSFDQVSRQDDSLLSWSSPSVSPTKLTSMPQSSPSQCLPMPPAEDEMPKSAWFQRMINTSIVGGITPDIHRDVESMISRQSMPRYLPTSNTVSPYVVNYVNHTSSQSPMYPQRPGMEYGMHVPSPHAVGMTSLPPTNYGNTIDAPSLLPQTTPPPPQPLQHDPSLLPQRPVYAAQSMPPSLAQAPTAFTAYNHTVASSQAILPPSSLNWNDWDMYIDHHQAYSQRHPHLPLRDA